MATNKIRTTVNFDKKVYDKLQELADKEDRSVSYLVNKIVAKELKASTEGDKD